MFRSFSLIICLLTLFSCQTTKSVASPKQIQLQKEFAETTTFKINSNWANPMPTASMNALNNSGLLAPGSSASRIDISQSNNHIIIEGTQLDMVLPYFGERQMGGGYNTGKNSGINYKGDIKDLKVEYNEKKKLYSISFSMSKTTESFNVSIDLFQNLTTRVNVNSSHRTSISFDGAAEELPVVTEDD